MKRNHAPGKLVPVTLRNLPDGWHADGGNLYLFVRGSSRTWVYRYVAPDGRRRNMGLGSLDSVGLAVARKQAEALRAKTKNALAPSDPLMDRLAERTARRLEKAKRMTFKQCAEACIEALRPGWKNDKHAAQWGSTLEAYAYPVFGSLPVSDVDTALVVKCLGSIWTAKNETASRLRGRIEKVLSWATTNGLRQGENPARWRGHLDNLLAKPAQVQKVSHHAALPFMGIGGFMASLRDREGSGARALEFAILTAARSGEVRGATWSEIDLGTAVWTIPAERMKAKREHRVPLSDAALELLKTLPRFDDCNLVFSGAKSDVPLSDMSLTAVLKRMERTDLTAHGFRSTFRDWAGETTGYPREVIENALAHQLKDKAEAAYARGTQFEKRRRLMEDWARYCAMKQAENGTVIAMRGAA